MCTPKTTRISVFKTTLRHLMIIVLENKNVHEYKINHASIYRLLVFGLHGRQELCENRKDEEYKLNYSNFSFVLFVKGKIYIMYSVNGRYVQTS